MCSCRSFPRKRESSRTAVRYGSHAQAWIPAFAGMSGRAAARQAAFAVVLSGMALTAQAGQKVSVLVSEHDGFGQLLLALPHHANVRQSRDGDRILLRFRKGVTLQFPSSLPRNVLAITGGNGDAILTVAHGAGLRQTWRGHRLVLDVLDPVAPQIAAASPAAAQPANDAPAPASTARPTTQAQPSATHKQNAPVPPAAAAIVAGPPSAPAPSPLSAATPPEPGNPSALTVTPSDTESDPDAAILVPFDANVGAAAFQRGSEALVVFDAPHPLDLRAVAASRMFEAAHAETTQAATVLRFVPPVGRTVSLQRTADGWRIAVPSRPAVLRALRPVAAEGQVALPATAAAHVVAIADPRGGGRLLVGTQLQAGENIPVQRRSAELALLATWQGVVVEALTDRLEMRPGPHGFVLSAPGTGLAVTPDSAYAEALDAAAGLTRRFDFSPLPPALLLRTLDEQITAAAAAPPLARGGPRRIVAQTMMALGLEAEAQALLQLAAAQDPLEAAVR